MPAAEASATCSRCKRPLNARMKREGDRVRTYWECPVCDQASVGSSGAGDPATPPSARRGDEGPIGNRDDGG
jgi:hypothetical protein